jgi:hypothetical protein
VLENANLDDTSNSNPSDHRENENMGCRFIVVIILFFNDSEVIAFTKTKAD